MTGLHCGVYAITRASERGRVFPVTVTGLHCGPTSITPVMLDNEVFPVTVTGLHCGTLYDEQGQHVLQRSSRSP